MVVPFLNAQFERFEKDFEQYHSAEFPSARLEKIEGICMAIPIYAVLTERTVGL